MIVLAAVLSVVLSGGLGPAPGVVLQNGGTTVGRVTTLNCTTGVLCSAVGAVGTVISTGISGGGNFGSTTISFGSGVSSATARTTVTGQTWVTASSKILANPFCDGQNGNTMENCWISNMNCYVANLVVGTGFDVVCFAPFNASGTFTINYTGQ
jgi:hypothetical protein